MNGQALGAEFLGTGLLLYVVVGSGLAIQRLDADPANGLFFHAAAVGLALTVLIVMFAAVSGAHFNPAVTLAVWLRGRIDGATAGWYLLGQFAGALVGVALAHVAFGEPLFSIAGTERAGWGVLSAELIGTLVLVLLILTLIDQNKTAWIGPTVGAWVATMVFSGSSTGFLNPAVTVSRTLTDSYTGIAPASMPGFVVAQLLGAVLALVASVFFTPVPEPKGI